MKTKVINTIIILVVLSILTTVTVWALNPTFTKQLKDMNWSKDNINCLDEVLQISREQFPDKIVEAYNRLGDWKAVRVEYGITDEQYSEWKNQQVEINKILDIPKYIYDEMKKKGYTEFKQKELIFGAHNAQLDIEYVWTEIKKGKTLEDVFVEKEAKEKKDSELLTDFIIGKIDLETYTKAVSTKNDTGISGVIEYAVNLRKKIVDRHIKESGITNDEINLCREYGMENIMDMCRAKYISKGNKIDLTKVLRAKKDTDDWNVVVSKILK